MKYLLELDDELHKEARRLALENNTTLKDLLIHGLRFQVTGQVILTDKSEEEAPLVKKSTKRDIGENEILKESNPDYVERVENSVPAEKENATEKENHFRGPALSDMAQGILERAEN